MPILQEIESRGPFRGGEILPLRRHSHLRIIQGGEHDAVTARGGGERAYGLEQYRQDVTEDLG